MRLLLLSFLFLTACNYSKPSLAKKVVIDINGRQMTAQEFAQELAYRLRDQDALSAKDPKFLTVIKAKITEEFVVQTLTEAWARENGVVVKAEDLEAQVQAVQKSYPDDLAFKQALTDEGTTFKAWRDRLQNTILQRQVARKVVDMAPPASESDLQSYYQSNKDQFVIRESAQVRQILVTTESDAKSIEVELKKGKKMSDLAKKYSISPEASQGGLVGWVEKGMSDIFETAFRLKQGQRSPIVKSPFGYHIFEVPAHKTARTKSFAESKGDIKRILMEKREQSLYLAWLEEQVRKARVFKDQAFIDALKVETRTE